jgi:hypothetical protein
VLGSFSSRQSVRYPDTAKRTTSSAAGHFRFGASSGPSQSGLRPAINSSRPVRIPPMARHPPCHQVSPQALAEKQKQQKRAVEFRPPFRSIDEESCSLPVSTPHLKPSKLRKIGRGDDPAGSIRRSKSRWPRPSAVRLSSHCRHHAALPRTGALGQ